MRVRHQLTRRCEYLPPYATTCGRSISQNPTQGTMRPCMRGWRRKAVRGGGGMVATTLKGGGGMVAAVLGLLQWGGRKVCVLHAIPPPRRLRTF